MIEGAPHTINQTKIMIDEIANLGVDRLSILVILNNRVRSEAQMAWTEVQQQLGHSIATTITPAPEMFMSAARVHTPAVTSQPTNVSSQQFLKIADLLIEHEKAK